MRDARGFTLAELLVVCAVLGLLMGGIFTLQRQSQIAYLMGAARVEVQQNARLGLDTMMNDLRLARLVDDLPDTTQVVSAIDANCSTGAPPTSGGGTSITVRGQTENVVAYTLVGASCATSATGCELQRNGTPVIGGVQSLQIWCYNANGALSNVLIDIREVRIQIRTRSERSVQAGSPGDQHAVVEGRLRFRNI
jgi:prepilin-type N-terminal cleavage/methylation domain-containing protein